MTLADLKSEFIQFRDKVTAILSGPEPLTAETLATHEDNWGKTLVAFENRLEQTMIESKDSLATAEKAHQDQLAELNKKHTAELAARDVNIPIQIAAEVKAIAAGQGIPQITIKPGTETVTVGKSLLDQFQSIKDPREKVEFWRKHKAELVRNRR